MKGEVGVVRARYEPAPSFFTRRLTSPLESRADDERDAAGDNGVVEAAARGRVAAHDETVLGEAHLPGEGLHRRVGESAV